MIKIIIFIRILATLVSYLVIAIFFCGHMIVSGDWVVVAIIITRKINISSSTILHHLFAQSDRPCVSFDTEVSDRLTVYWTFSTLRDDGRLCFFIFKVIRAY